YLHRISCGAWPPIPEYASSTGWQAKNEYRALWSFLTRRNHPAALTGGGEQVVLPAGEPAGGARLCQGSPLAAVKVLTTGLTPRCCYPEYCPTACWRHRSDGTRVSHPLVYVRSRR